MTQRKPPSKAIQRIKSLRKSGSYEEALAQCDDLLRKSCEDRADILRERAWIYEFTHKYDQALLDRKTVIDEGRPRIEDYYHAAEIALFANPKQCAQAVEWFKEVLRLGELQKESWFASASYFYLSYAQMELGQFEEAITNLDRAVAISPDVGMVLPPTYRICRHGQLRDEITRRAKRSSDAVS